MDFILIQITQRRKKTIKQHLLVELCPLNLISVRGEFNVIIEKVAAFQLFHNKCYTIGLKSESDIWYDSFGLNLKYKNGDLCGETLQYSVQFQIQCGEETPFKQVMTDSPCNIKLQSTHPMACRTKESYLIYYILIAVVGASVIFLKYRKRRQEQGYVLV